MWTCVRPLSSSPSSPPPAQYIASAAVAVQSVSWTVIDAAQSLRDQDLSSAVSPSTHCWGGLNRTSVRKSLQGEKGTLCSSPTRQKIQSACTAYPPFSPSPWDELKSATTITRCKYPLAPVWWAESERQSHDWAGSYFNYYTFKTHAAFWGAGEINFLCTPHLRDEGAVIQRAAATYSHNLQPAL